MDVIVNAAKFQVDPSNDNQFLFAGLSDEDLPGDEEDGGVNRFYLTHLNYTEPISQIFGVYTLLVLSAPLCSVFALAFIGIFNRFFISIERPNQIFPSAGTASANRKKRSDDDFSEHNWRILELVHHMDESLRRLKLSRKSSNRLDEAEKLVMICQEVKGSRGRLQYQWRRRTEIGLESLLRFLDEARNLTESIRLESSSLEGDTASSLRTLEAYVSAARLGAEKGDCDKVR